MEGNEKYLNDLRNQVFFIRNQLEEKDIQISTLFKRGSEHNQTFSQYDSVAPGLKEAVRQNTLLRTAYSLMLQKREKLRKMQDKN